MHGAPLGAEETAATRKNLGWTYGEFEVPQDVYDVFRQVRAHCSPETTCSLETYMGDALLMTGS